MPTNLADAKTGGSDLIFASDAEGTEFRLTEPAVYEAEEVRDEIGDDETPAFGRWIPIETPDGDGWLNAVGELVEELQTFDAEEGDLFEVSRCEKSGGGETDPYEVNLVEVEPDQSRL